MGAERVLGHEVRPLVGRHDVAGIGKGAVPTDVVDMKVRVHDEVHLIGARACTCELSQESRARIRHERARRRPEPGVDEHCRAVPADENGVDG